MREPDVGDDADGRAGDRAERGDVTGLAGAELQHQRLGVERRAEERDREADLGVEVPGRGVHPVRGAQRRRGEVFRARLAGGTGDADDEGVGQLIARPASDGGQRGEARRRPAPLPHPARLPARPRPTTGRVTSATVAPWANASATKSWPSRAAWSATKHAPRRERARVVGERGRARVAGARDQRPAGHRGDLARRSPPPECPELFARDVAVVERQGGRRRSSDRSRALSRDHDDVAGGRRCGARGGSRRGGRARRRPRRRRRGPGAPRRRSRCGSSDRGVVRREDGQVGAPPRGRAHERSLRRVTVAPAAEDHDDPPLPLPSVPARARAAPSTASSSPGAWA